MHIRKDEEWWSLFTDGITIYVKNLKESKIKLNEGNEQDCPQRINKGKGIVFLC